MRKSLDTTLTDTCGKRRDEFVGVPDSGIAESSTTTALDRGTARLLLSLIGDPPIRFVLWDGQTAAGAATDAALHVRDRAALYRLLTNPELYFGELYCAGRVAVSGDLADFLATVYRHIHYRDGTPLSRWRRQIVSRRPRSNSTENSRDNIQRHYDLSNHFYEQWLDKEMQYTCAYFPQQGMTLEQAQIEKMHHICRKLQLQPGQTVVEAGCGWGGLARFMAQYYGVRVRAYNISHQQILYATDRAVKAGLSGQVEYIEDDYRNIRGRYDVFVSIGMLEHVGIDNYGTLGGVIDSCLKDKGMALIHTIGRNRPGFLNAWIERNIFPGACPPTIAQMMGILEPWSFSVLDIENLRLHYARTLEHWLSRYEQGCAELRHVYDEKFIRAWRLYLAGSIAGFTSGTMQLFQVLFTRPQNNDIPWTREQLYKH